MNKADREYIRKRKQVEPFTGFREKSRDGEECKVQILGRGESAFYQQGERALLLEVLAGRGVIFATSIRRWDDGRRVSDQERESIIEVVSRVLKRLGAEHVEVVP